MSDFMLCDVMAGETLNTTTPSTPNPYTTLLDEDKNTVLHYSAAKGRKGDFVKKSLKNQKLDPENYLGWTPLMMACRNAHIDTVKVLLELGADVTKKNRYGMSVFSISIAGGKLEIVKIILEHLLAGGVSKRIMQNILSPISLSILFRHHDILEYTIKHKFDLNAATPSTGVTSLMFAAAMEDKQAIALLLENGADQTIKNHLGETADEIKKSRHHKHDPIRKPEPLKLTPAEMISRSPHMAPCFLSPRDSYLNLNPAQLICIRKSPCHSPAILVTPGVSPITPMGMPHVFFPEQFPPDHFMAISPLQIPNYNFLNVKISPSQTELILTSNID